MKRIFALLAMIALAAIALVPASKNPHYQIQFAFFEPKVAAIPATEGPSKLKIRMGIAKHCRERMADDDANLAAGSVRKAASAGLDIRVIGNDYVQGYEEFRRVVDKDATAAAAPGDTLVLHTIGHGMPNGTLVTLGQRAKVMEILADSAEKNRQRILWWQLSCHAAAELPPVSSLSELKRKFLNILASSTAQQQSPTQEQARIMEKVFMALAMREKGIDPDGNDVITAQEMRSFLNALDGRRRGDLLFSQSNNQPIFGSIFLSRQIPILDRNDRPRRYPDDYIPVPGQ